MAARKPRRKQRSKQRPQRVIAHTRARQTAKNGRSETAKGGKMLRNVSIAGRSRTAIRAEAKPLKALRNAKSRCKSRNKSGEKSAEIRWSRPSPRSGVRLPLGAHPWNTGGKKGRSGPKRPQSSSSELFGSEYFAQSSQQEKPLTKPLTTSENTIENTVENTERYRSSSSKIDLFRKSPMAKVEESSRAGGSGSVWVYPPNIGIEYADLRVQAPPGKMVSEWDPFRDA